MRPPRLDPAVRREMLAACTFCALRGAADDRARLEAAIVALPADLPQRMIDLAAAARAFLQGAGTPADRQGLDGALKDFYAARPAPPPHRPWWIDSNGGGPGSPSGAGSGGDAA